MLIATTRLAAFTPSPTTSLVTLALTAEERSRSRHRFTTPEGQIIFLRLPRGTVLKHQDYLATEEDTIIQVLAKPEPVLTVTARDSLLLLRGAYHLGNRHIPVEIGPDYLRLAPDPVLQDLLIHLGLTVQPAVMSFQPEAGAYHHH